jgi:hypothetical protein
MGLDVIEKTHATDFDVLMPHLFSGARGCRVKGRWRRPVYSD